MSSRVTRLACVFLLGGLAVFGCTEATPDYCQKSADCPAGWICDVARAVCVSPDGAAGPMDGAGAYDAASDAVDAPGGEAGVTVDAPAPDDAGLPEDSGIVDAVVPDVYVPDGAGTCGANSDCPNPTLPFCIGNVCVGCQAAAAAACGALVCDAVSGRCVECTADSQCTKDAAKGFCVANACTGCATPGATGCAARGDGKTTCATSGAAAGQCVECAADTDCKDAGKSFCVANVCGGCQTAETTACSTRLASKSVCATSGTASGTCVECSADADCKDPTKSFCVANVCGGCQTAAATACSTRLASKPVCATSGTASGTCVECSADADCTDATKSFCVANVCGGCQTAAATACSDRSASKPVCATSGTASGTCVECAADADCGDAAKSFCVANACGGCQTAAATACAARSASKPACATSGTLSGQCVQCAASSDCAAATLPICGAANTCVPCTADAECVAKLGTTGYPGVCMANLDGHCATDAETVYVVNKTGCSSSTSGGTASAPFCLARTGVNSAVANTKPLVVLSGALADGFSVSTPGVLTIVGKGAIITPAAFTDGIDVASGEVYLRSLTVNGSVSTGSPSNPGIAAATGAFLHMDTCSVIDNPGGGILLNGAAFDIENTVITGNGPGQTTGGTFWGGIRVDSLPTSGSTILNLATVETNNPVGVSCSGSITGTGVLVTGNTSAQIANSCGFNSCTSASNGCGAQ